MKLIIKDIREKGVEDRNASHTLQKLELLN
jgi:hypothetical protein